MGTDDQIPGAAPMAPQASASTPVGTLAQTGGVAVTWLPALALALLAAGALLTLRRRTV